MADAVPKGAATRFHSNKLAKLFDVRWTGFIDILPRDQFIALGYEMVKRANRIAEVVNQLLDNDWQVISGASTVQFNLNDLVGVSGASVLLSHTVDMTLRDPQEVEHLIDFKAIRLSKTLWAREVFHSPEIRINNLVLRRMKSPESKRATSICLEGPVYPGTYNETDERRTIGWLRDIVLCLQGGQAPQIRVTELNCGRCPVQDFCDSPRVYDNILDERTTEIA